MAVAGAGAEIMVKAGAENNFGSATLVEILMIYIHIYLCQVINLYYSNLLVLLKSYSYSY